MQKEYNRLLKDYMEANNITSPRDVPAQIQNDLYLSVVGWRKGNVLGLGSEVYSYYEKPRSSASASSSSKMAMELEHARRSKEQSTTIQEQGSRIEEQATIIQQQGSRFDLVTQFLSQLS
ncbi:hypothetical protein Drorol1_Dr00020880 [Drosera rotundifolia]